MAAVAWQRARSERHESFDDGDVLFAEPAWDMLLDLYINENRARQVPIGSLSIAARVPQTTALRWIRRMVDTGLFTRRVDRRDGRRVLISLTPDGRRRLETALDRAIAGFVDVRTAIQPAG